MRAKILDLLAGKKIDVQPAFSGLIHVTTGGLEKEGLNFHEIHQDAVKMAKAAASTFQLTGMPSATLPLDLCLPAEVLGAELFYYEQEENRLPQVSRPIVESAKAVPGLNLRQVDRGRIPLVCEAIGRVKGEIGTDAVISGMIPGPYTLLLYLCDTKSLFVEMKREPQLVADALLVLSSFLVKISAAYQEAGADFITIHEMGGSPGFIGPAGFEQFVLPALKLTNENIRGTRVLSVCGNTNSAMHLLAQAGANAISVDQTNDLAASRAVIKDVLLFGNIDPVQTLWQGSEAMVMRTAQDAKEAGIDAVWPGCDLVPGTPIQNIIALTA